MCLFGGGENKPWKTLIITVYAMWEIMGLYLWGAIYFMDI